MERQRGNGEGTIDERTNPSGATVFRARTPPGAGRRSATFKTRREARQWLAEQSVDRRRGILAKGRSQRLDAYLDGWLGTVKPSIKPSTFDTYRRNARRISAELGAVRLDQLAPAHVQDLVNALGEQGLAPRSVRQVHLTLHKALSDAMKLELVYRNVADSVSLPRIGHRDEAWYSTNELQRLYDVTEGDRFAALWVLLGTVGLRLGEALGLTWSDIDPKKGTLSVRRTLQRERNKGGKLVFMEPKSKASRRTIRLSETARRALQAHQERQAFEKRKAAELWQDHDLVFTSELGTPLEQGRVHRHWTAAVARAGIPRYRLHDLRHTAATLLTIAGMRPQDVARVLGHSNPALVVSLYGHAAPDAQDQAAALMDAILTRPQAAQIAP